jgi:hypothetical protein
MEIHDITGSSIVSRWIDAFNAHDVTSIVALYADDAELFDSGMPRPRYGRDEIHGWFSWRFRSTPTISYTPTGQIHIDDERVVVKWVVRGHGPRLVGARSFETPGESIFTLRDDRIYKQRGNYDHLSVLKQVFPPFKWLPDGVARLVYALYLRRGGITV